MAMELRLQCMDCFVSIGTGPLRPATVVFLNTLAAEHVCATATSAPPLGSMTAEEVQALVDKDKATS